MQIIVYLYLIEHHLTHNLIQVNIAHPSTILMMPLERGCKQACAAVTRPLSSMNQVFHGFSDINLHESSVRIAAAGMGAGYTGAGRPPKGSSPERLHCLIYCFTIVPHQHVLEGLSKQGQLKSDLILVRIIIIQHTI